MPTDISKVGNAIVIGGNGYITGPTKFEYMTNASQQQYVRLHFPNFADIAPIDIFLNDLTVSGSAASTPSVATAALGPLFPKATSTGGSGGSVTDASQLSTGTLSDSRLSANVPIKVAGSLGIGTTTPAYKLDVNDGLGVRFNNLGLGQGLHLKRDTANGGGYEYVVGVGVPGVDDTQFSIKDVLKNSYRFVIDQNGKAGIGTSTPTSSLHVNGSLATAIINKTSDYTATEADNTITGDATAGAFTITLPSASSCVGRFYALKKTDASANAITVATAGGNIDGASTYSLPTQYKRVSVQSDGTIWQIIASN